MGAQIDLSGAPLNSSGVLGRSRLVAAFGIGLQALAAHEARFPALRIGAHTGSVLYREGDYLGANVNLAARVTSAAERNQFLVTNSVRAGGPHLDAEFAPLGARALKGIGEPVELFEVRSDRELRQKQTDPVCGMELDEASSDAELTWQGQRVLFCSERCLRLFLQRSPSSRPDPNS